MCQPHAGLNCGSRLADAALLFCNGDYLTVAHWFSSIQIDLAAPG